jgi:hypothetical protein
MRAQGGRYLVLSSKKNLENAVCLFTLELKWGFPTADVHSKPKLFQVSAYVCQVVCLAISSLSASTHSSCSVGPYPKCKALQMNS